MMKLWDEPSVLPWDLHRALTSDRLSAVAGIIRQTRDGAARGAKRGQGDDAWVIGTTAYKRAIAALAKAAANEYADWLSTERVKNHHLIKIIGVPVRHYRGIEDYPVPSKYCEAVPGEDAALELALEGGAMPIQGGHFRIEVTTTAKSFTDAIRFVVVDGQGQRYHEWTIPQFTVRREGQHGMVELGKAGTRRQGLRVISSEKEAQA
jgi:hypothetical protein